MSSPKTGWTTENELASRPTQTSSGRLDIHLEESELEAFWPGGGGSENLTGVRAKRMRDRLKLSGPWRRARILWTREPYKREFPPEVVYWP